MALRKQLTIYLFVLLTAPLLAGIPPTKWQEDGSDIGIAFKVDCQDNVTCTKNGNVIEIDGAGVTETDPTLTDDNAVTIGDNTTADPVLTFDGSVGTDGTITWDESADDFAFNGALQVTAAPFIYFDSDLNTFIDAGNPDGLAWVVGNDQVFSTQDLFAGTDYIEFNGQNKNYDTIFNGDTKADLLYIDAGTDQITVGNTTPIALFGIDGFADEIQFVVQGHSTQTSNLVVFENSGGTDLFTMTNAGALTLSGYDCSGNANGGALTADASGNITCTDDDSGSTSPGGADTQIQYNESGAFGAEAAFVWDRTNDELELGASGTDTTILFNDDTATSPGIYWDEDVNEILAKVWGTDDAGSANHGFRVVSEKASSSAYFTVEAVTADRSIMLVGDNGNTHHLQTTGTDAPGFMFVVGSNQILPTEGPATHNTTATLQDGTISFGRDANRWDIYADLIDSDTTVDFGEALVEINNQTDCSGRTAEGAICWDSDNDVLYVGDGVAAASIGGSETNALESDGASGIADTEIFIGTGAGTGNYASISGDATLANTGALTIASDAIEESMLKAVNSPTDEYVLTYETTTGDFEWQAQTGGASTFNYTFNADQAKLPSSNPCIIYNPSASVTSYLLCDDSTDESATWSTTLAPFNAGTITAQVYYSMVSATSGNVDIEVSIMCVSDADAADIDTESFAAAGAANATVPGTAGYMDVLTITPTDDSCAANDLLVVKVNRDANDATNDTATGDVEIRKVRLYEA